LLFRFLIVVAAWSLGQVQAKERHIGKGPRLVFHGASQALGQAQHWLPGEANGGTAGKGDGHRYLMNPLLDANNNGQADLVE